MRHPQEHLACGADDGTKPTLGDGITLRNVGGAIVDRNPNRLARCLEPAFELRSAIAVLHRTDALAKRIGHVPEEKLEGLRRLVFRLDGKAEPHARSVISEHSERRFGIPRTISHGASPHTSALTISSRVSERGRLDGGWLLFFLSPVA